MNADETTKAAELSSRFERARAAMEERGIDFLLIGPSTDMVYLIDFPVRQSERLTILVIGRDGPVRFVMPGFELPRIEGLPKLFEPVTWDDGDDPVAVLASLLPDGGRSATIGIGGQMFAQFFLPIRDHVPSASYVNGDEVMAPLR